MPNLALTLWIFSAAFAAPVIAADAPVDESRDVLRRSVNPCPQIVAGRGLHAGHDRQHESYPHHLMGLTDDTNVCNGWKTDIPEARLSANFVRLSREKVRFENAAPITSERFAERDRSLC
jgi:hypothetical protein